MPQISIGVPIFVLIISLIYALGTSIFCGAVCSHFAGKKGRSKTGYFFLGFFFRLLGIIVILLLDDLRRGKKRRIVYEEYLDDDDEYEYE